MTAKGATLLAFFFVGTVLGNILFKHAAVALAPVAFNTATMRAILSSPSAISGAVFYFGAAIVWFMALSIVPLNLAISVSAMVYIAVVLIAWLVFGEAIPSVRWLGIALTVSGLMVIAWTS